MIFTDQELEKVRYPTPDGHVEKWQKWQRWVDPMTDVRYVRFSVRLTKLPIPGLDGVLKHDSSQAFFTVAEPKQIDAGEPDVTVYAYETRSLMANAKDLHLLVEAVQHGEVPVKREGMAAALLGTAE